MDMLKKFIDEINTFKIGVYVWFIALLVIIIALSYRLLKDSIKASRLTGSKTINKNPFSTEESAIFPNLTELIEREYGQVMPILSIVASVITWGLLYSLQEEFDKYFRGLDRFKEATIAFIIVSFTILGITFMRNLLKNLGSGNDLHDTKNNQILLQRAKTVVTTYLSFILGALIFTFLSDISLEFKIVRYAPISFILGSIFYLLLRQRPEKSNIAKLFFAVVQSPNLKLKTDKDYRNGDEPKVEYFSEHLTEDELETQYSKKEGESFFVHESRYKEISGKSLDNSSDASLKYDKSIKDEELDNTGKIEL